MSVIAKLKGMAEYKKYLKTLVLSAALAFLMLYIAFGLMFFAKRGNPVPVYFILLIAAIFFVFFTVFYESKGKTKSKSKESLKSLIKGLFLAICATFAFVAIVGGVKFMVYIGFELIGGIGAVISALAICMIVSTVFLTLLTPS
jgi:hypothetical protein